MTDKPSRILTYKGRELTVEYEIDRCIHAAECVHGLKTVFDPDRKPWVDPDAADAKDVARVVARCPTGALRIRAAAEETAGIAEASPEGNTIRTVPNGPLYFHGQLRIRAADGTEVEEYRAALCRCGESTNKPYCDNSHQECSFEDPGELGEGRLRQVEEDESESASGLVVTVAANGPLLLTGLVELQAADGRDTMIGNRGALCRCGASLKKPYCDGSHKTIGFQAE